MVEARTAADLAPSYAAKRSEPSRSDQLLCDAGDSEQVHRCARRNGRERELGDESPGARSTVVGVQAVEEFPDRPPRSEHVKGHMLPMLRNDLVFALRF